MDHLPPLINSDQLGQYPILQFGMVAIGFVITVIGSLAYLKGERSGKKTNDDIERAQQPIAELNFSGPFQDVIDRLTDIKGRQLVARLETKEDFAALLSTSKHSIMNGLAEVQAEVIDCIQQSTRDINQSGENRTRDITTNLTNILIALSRIEAAMAIRR